MDSNLSLTTRLTTSKQTGVTWKSVAVAICLIPLSYYWIIVGEVGLVGYALNTYAVPFYNVVFTVFLLVILNSILKRSTSIQLFTANELLTTYILLSAACALPSITLMTILVTTVGHAFWFNTPENEWRQLFWDQLPSWLTVRDKDVLAGYYQGDSTFYLAQHLIAWIQPTLYWSLFVTVLIFMMLCINTIIRKQWIEHEHLSYPIAQLPYRFITQTGSLFSYRIVWIGFCTSALIGIFNGVSFLIPSLPEIPIKRIGGWQGFGHLFTEKPWNEIGRISVSFYPFVIGLGLLMPLDLSFSSWIFFLFYKAQLVLSSTIGLTKLPGFPYIDRQCLGAAIGLFLTLLLFNLNYLKGVIKTAYEKSDTDRHEPVSYRFALSGLVFGLGFLCLFSWGIGMSFWLVPIFFAIYLVIIIVLTRMRAELGFPVHAMENMQMDQVLIDVLGTRWLGKSNLVAISLYRWFIRSFTSHPMPHQLEGFKLAGRTGIDTRRLYYALVGIAAFGAMMVFWVILHIFYQHGALNGSGWSYGFGRRVYSGLQQWLYYPKEPNYYAILAIILGALFSGLLIFMRTRFLWWPFHPVGFVISSDWGMAYLWTCLLVSWLIKWAVLRIGGFSSAQHLTRFAIGLILGDFVIGGLWSSISIITQRQMYNFWP